MGARDFRRRCWTPMAKSSCACATVRCHVRSKRTATAYIGQGGLKLTRRRGFVDTDDVVEQKGDRLLLQLPPRGVINVGGLKVHPEEVEQVINEHSEVRMSRAAPGAVRSWAT